MTEILAQLEDYRAGRGGQEERSNLEKELKDLMRITLETPASLRKRVELMNARFREYEQAKRELSGGNLQASASRTGVPTLNPINVTADSSITTSSAAAIVSRSR